MNNINLRSPLGVGRRTGGKAGKTTLTFTLYHGALGGGHEEEGGTFVVPATVTAPQQ